MGRHVVVVEREILDIVAIVSWVAMEMLGGQRKIHDRCSFGARSRALFTNERL